ncbi:MAG TPA: serine hydrolase domain-containing protein [Burkholderiales bacterium]|nr:serine hydrolase domain-containing protein [Burkholderiales bacterium]
MLRVEETMFAKAQRKDGRHWMMRTLDPRRPRPATGQQLVAGNRFTGTALASAAATTRIGGKMKAENIGSERGRGYQRLTWATPVLLAALITGCGGAGGDPDLFGVGTCTNPQTSALEAQMDGLLDEVDSEVDFSFAVDRRDGRRYVFNRGNSTLQTSYESKSASKLVSAVIILRLVEQGYLTLSDRPQDHISGWPITGSNPLTGMNLAQLLSFTSGLQVDPACLENGSSDFESCVITVAEANDGNGTTPGQQFFYASAHLQVAGLMAVEARDLASWQVIVAEFKSQTGLFGASNYDHPSSSNPSLAGGMHFTGNDYLGFLKALRAGLLLDATSMGQLLTDHTASIDMVYSPIFSGIGGGAALGEDWHYGFGLWHECQSATFNCAPGTRVSSPGALGTYPFWDRSKRYSGIVVRAGDFGTLTTGIEIERSVRSSVDQWATC